MLFICVCLLCYVSLLRVSYVCVYIEYSLRWWWLVVVGLCLFLVLIASWFDWLVVIYGCGRKCVG